MRSVVAGAAALGLLAMGPELRSAAPRTPLEEASPGADRPLVWPAVIDRCERGDALLEVWTGGDGDGAPPRCGPSWAPLPRSETAAPGEGDAQGVMVSLPWDRRWGPCQEGAALLLPVWAGLGELRGDATARPTPLPLGTLVRRDRSAALAWGPPRLALPGGGAPLAL